MKRYAIDTNVPVVANGRDEGDRPVSPACRAATIRFLQRIVAGKAKVAMDLEGEVQKEYRTYLNPSGEPGVGDRFYLQVLQNASLCERVSLARRSDDSYADLPRAISDSGFDPSDWKFAALALCAGAEVANATDSDWLEHRALLAANGVAVEFLCGCDAGEWFHRPVGHARGGASGGRRGR